MSMTVTEAAIAYLEKQRQAHNMRSKQIAAEFASAQFEDGDLRIPADVFEALIRPVRIEVDFRDPIHTRQQLEVLQAAISEALPLTRQHEKGINRQRLQLHTVIKTAADTLTMINGKTPAGKRRRKMEEYHRMLDEQEKQNGR